MGYNVDPGIGLHVGFHTPSFPLNTFSAQITKRPIEIFLYRSGAFYVQILEKTDSVFDKFRLFVSIDYRPTAIVKVHTTALNYFGPPIVFER
jgi:hypothetical protein